MDAALPHAHDTDEFQQWLLDRLSSLSNITFDPTKEPIHTSYEDWNVWGVLSQTSPTHKSNPSSPASTGNVSPATRPPLVRLPSRESKVRINDKVLRKVIVRVSRHVLRLERQYQTIKQLSEVDTAGEHHVRAIQLLRLHPRDGKDEPALAAIILEDPGPLNGLRRVLNYGPNWFPISRTPSEHPYNPAIASDYTSPTGEVSVDVFLKFALGAAKCCALLHDNNMVHGEIRPDSFFFDPATSAVKWINQGSGIRAFENGLQSGNWTWIARSYGISFKLQFVAPEQTGRLFAAPDQRTDIYSLGQLFFLLLTGTIPFDGSTAIETLQNILGRRAPLLSSRRDGLPLALSSIISKMTQRNIEERYHSVKGLIWDLKQVANLFQASLTSSDPSTLDEFEPGLGDANCIFRVPEVQIGREKEKELVLDTLAKFRRRQKRFQNVYAHHAAADVENSPEGITAQRTLSTDGVRSSSASEKSRSTASIQLSDNVRFNEGGLGSGSNSTDRRHPLDRIASGEATSDFGSSQALSSMNTYSESPLSAQSARGDQRLNRHARTEIVNVFGPAGLGKSTFVTSLLGDCRKNALVAVTKFEQENSNPFQPMTRLMANLFRQIFMDASSASNHFHSELETFVRPIWPTLSHTLGLPLDLIDSVPVAEPDYERRQSISVVSSHSNGSRMLAQKTIGAGRCRKATEFLRTGTASKSSRLQAMFISVLRFLAKKMTLVLVLEDVECADAESIELLSSILHSRIMLMMIFTCRSRDGAGPGVNRVLTSPLAKITSIELYPLTEDEIARLISTTLHRSTDYCFPLAYVALHRTEGTPFALKTFLEECYKKNFIWYSWKDQMWEYDFEKSFEHFAGSSSWESNDFILERLQELPASSRLFLAFACFLGSPFRFSLVKTLMQAEHEEPTSKKVKLEPSPDLIRRSSQDAVRGLEALLAASVLTETEEDDLFDFCHSRYRTAAKRLAECGRKDWMCFKISEILIQDQQYKDEPFYKARYVCVAIKLIKTKVTVRKPYRDVLLQAAEQCTETNCKDSAFQYLSNALSLLQDNPWADDEVDTFYSETLMLHLRAAEAFARSYSDAAIQLLETIIKNARNVFDRTPAYLSLGRIQVQTGHVAEAFETLKTALSGLGIDIPDTTWEECDAEFLRLKDKMEALDPEEFDNQLATDDNTLTAVGEVVAEAMSSAFWTNALACYQLSLIFARKTLEDGITNHSGLALANFGSVAVGRWDMVPLGVKMSIMAEKHFNRFEDDYATGRGLGVCALQTEWLHQPMRPLVARCDFAMNRALNANDRNAALMNASFGAMFRIWSSWDMADLESFGMYVSDLVPWENDRRGGILLTTATQYARAFQGKTKIDSAETIFDDDSHDRATYIEWAMTHSSSPHRVMAAYAQFLLPALYVFGYHEAAVELAERDILPTLESFFGARVRANTLFYLSMAYLATSTEKEGEKIAFAERTLKKLKKWSEVDDTNLLAWTSLITAELEERKCEFNLAVTTYEAALDHCELHNFTFELGVVYEHYAEFLIRRGANRLARSALRDATAAFKGISCHGKAAHISKKHEWLLKGTTSLNAVDAGCQTDDYINVPPGNPNSPTVDPNAIHPTPYEGGANIDRTRSFAKDDADLHALGLDVVDVSNILQSSQALSSTLQIDELLHKMADIMRASAGADMAAIVIKSSAGEWTVAAVSDSQGREFPTGDPLEKVDDIMGKYITMYCIRFRETVFVESTAEDERFADISASAVRHEAPKSVFTAPIIHNSEVLGAVYVENAPHSFTSRNLTVLRALLPSVSISIANANLFKKLEKADAKNKIMIGAQREALAQAREAEAKAQTAREEALESLRQKEEAAKAKSLFLANTSHELRTPLNGVIGMSELLKSSKLSADQESYCDSIRVCADTLLQVINDILDFSKLEAGKLQLYAIPVSLHETIVEVVRALSFSNQQKKVETITDLAFHEDLIVTSDPVRLHQVLMNILSNAYKFTSEGSVTVKGVVKKETKKDIEVVISVQDTGIGIDETAKKKLFMPFSQADSGTSRAYGGTGLGLSICKAIVESAMDGKIWLDSEKGVGTTVSFQLTLPKVVKGRGISSENVPRANPMKVFTPDQESNRELRLPSQDLSALPREEIRIAIAEDNMVNQKIAMKYVAKLGFPCEAFNDGEACVEGLKKADDEGKPFSIVLMDCQMPKMDGYDATRTIRKDPSSAINGVIIIAMTASAIRGDREKCLEAGMSAYLAKPVKQDMLKRMIDSYVSPMSPIPDDDDKKTFNGNGTNGTATLNGATNGLGQEAH